VKDTTETVTQIVLTGFIFSSFKLILCYDSQILCTELASHQHFSICRTYNYTSPTTTTSEANNAASIYHPSYKKRTKTCM